MDRFTENDYAHWLFNVPGVGIKSADLLLDEGRSCRDVFEMDVRELKGLLSSKQVKNLEESRRTWNFDRERQKLKDRGIRFISRCDDDFPEKLCYIPQPPFGIYIKGELPDPNKPSVAIIGARMCSEYGRYEARQFGMGLAMAGVQVISGMARGVDGISQKAALAAGGRSFGVLGCGVDICYPEENNDVYKRLCQEGGIISEYPPGTAPKANFFPMRNRIISGLADVVLVIEAREKSGTQITVDTALEQGREVLAVPGRVTDRLSDGCNILISQGAGIAIGVEDVLERIRDIRNGQSPHIVSGISKKSRGAGISLPEACDEADCEDMLKEQEKEPTLEEHILSSLDIIPVSTSAIMEKLYQKGIDITVQRLMQVLMDMTYNGQIVQNGAYYRKIA